MARTDINFLDWTDKEIKVPFSRKIKFKKISFTNISAGWRNFRINRAKSKLISEKEKLVGMGFKGDQLVYGEKREQTERKVLKKTNAIARLESKVNFLETGNYLTEEFVNSRAIKLKDMMMKNLVWNRELLYSVNEQTAAQIMAESYNEPESRSSIANPESSSPETTTDSDEKLKKEMREIEAEIAKSVQDIMSKEKGAAELPTTVSSASEHSEDNVAASTDENNATDFVAPSQATYSVEEPTETSVISSEDVVRREEIAEAINSAMAKIEVAKPKTSDNSEKNHTEFNKVSRNESSPAKVNKFIKDDGTYRMKREDIDEDFRITKFDRSQLPTAINTPLTGESDIPPFYTERKKVPDIEGPRKAITQISRKAEFTIKPLESPTINYNYISETQSASRDFPVVTPDRNNLSLQKNREESSIDEYSQPQPSLSDEFLARVARVNAAKAEAETLNSTIEAEIAKRKYLTATLDETIGQLAQYEQTLVAQNEEANERMLALQEENNTTEAQIEQMIAIMGDVFGGYQVSEEKTGARVR